MSSNTTAFSHAEGMRGKPGKKKWSDGRKGTNPLAKLKEQCLPEGWYANIGTRFTQLKRNLVQKCKQGMVRRKVETACAMAGGDAKECVQKNKNIQKLVPVASTRINLENQDPALLVSAGQHTAQPMQGPPEGLRFPKGVGGTHALPLPSSNRRAPLSHPPQAMREEMEEDEEEDDGLPTIAEDWASVAGSAAGAVETRSGASRASAASKASTSLSKALNAAGGSRKTLNEALTESMLYVQVGTRGLPPGVCPSLDPQHSAHQSAKHKAHARECRAGSGHQSAKAQGSCMGAPSQVRQVARGRRRRRRFPASPTALPPLVRCLHVRRCSAPRS